MCVLFWQEFVNNKNWLHLDIAGVMSNSGDVAYLGKGMSGIEESYKVQFFWDGGVTVS